MTLRNEPTFPSPPITITCVALVLKGAPPAAVTPPSSRVTTTASPW